MRSPSCHLHAPYIRTDTSIFRNNHLFDTIHTFDTILLHLSRLQPPQKFRTVTSHMTSNVINALLESREHQLTAILGDLSHKRVVLIHFGTFGPAVQYYFTSAHQAEYLREHYPELVPPPQQPGQPTSDKKLGDIFEWHFEVSPTFQHNYGVYLSHQQLNV